MSDSGIPDRAAVLAALDAVLDPRTGRGLVSAGLVNGLLLRQGRAAFMLEVPASMAALYAPVRDAAEQAMRQAPNVEVAQVVLTSESAAAAPRTARPTPKVAEDPQARLAPAQEAQRPEHVRKVIAIASGKGGVGKSTVAVNLAVAFAQLGLRAGLLDADVYGPSAPQMFGVNEDPAYDEEKKLHPLEAFGVKVMSIGFIAEEGVATIWRGPMASSAVRTLTHQVKWGTQAEPLDVLVVDLPPGTGDIHLTIVQRLKLDGAVIVSTPSEVALIDARRAASMFEKTGTTVLGVVENMSFFSDPSTGARIPIFGTGGGRAEAERLGVPLLAELPLEVAVREGGDEGRPIVATDPDSPSARAFMDMAKVLAG